MVFNYTYSIAHIFGFRVNIWSLLSDEFTNRFEGV